MIARDHDYANSITNNGWISWLIEFLRETSKPIVTVCAIIVFAAMYKAGAVIQKLLRELNDSDDLYTCETHALKVPTSKQFPFKVTKMIVDEQDILVTAYLNGSVYVWDLYSNSCQYYVNRRYDYPDVSLHFELYECFCTPAVVLAGRVVTSHQA